MDYKKRMADISQQTEILKQDHVKIKDRLSEIERLLAALLVRRYGRSAGTSASGDQKSHAPLPSGREALLMGLWLSCRLLLLAAHPVLLA